MALAITEIEEVNPRPISEEQIKALIKVFVSIADLREECNRNAMLAIAEEVEMPDEVRTELRLRINKLFMTD